MNPRAPLPDSQIVMIAWLTAARPTTRTVAALPANLGQELPLLQVLQVSAQVTSRTQVRATIDVNAYEGDADRASTLAALVEALLLGSVNVPAGGAVIRSVASIQRPRLLPYANPSVCLYGGTYQVLMRPQAAAA